MNTRKIGAWGENAAADYLIGKGLTVLTHNYAASGGEIDLICQDGAITVFVEVKARTGTLYGRPAEAVTIAKQRRIIQTALAYLQKRGLQDCRIRFDVVEIMPGVIRHIENAFDATGF